LRVIFDHAEQIALALYDAPSAKLLTASPRYLQIVRRLDMLQPQDVIGSEWHNLECVVPRDESLRQWNHVLETRETIRIPEIRSPYGADGEDTVWDWSLTPILDANHQVRYMLVSAVEITDQVRVRQELERLDRLKDEFFSVASHELRTPMTPLMGFADMLARSIGQGTNGGDARISRMVNSMQGQLRRLNRLIEDLLDVARLQSGKFTLEQEAVSLAALLEQVVMEARAQSPDRTINLVLPPPDEPPLVVLGDDVRLHQVVLNLMQNAIKHASTSPCIDLRLRRVHDEQHSMDMAEIAVQDYGQGIAPDALPTTFDRFYQGTRPQGIARNGLGLGLYVVKQLVEQHNGTVAVESAVGAGSTFTVRLPLAPAHAAPSTPEHTASP
jgi:signal transduction histidine kinase